MRGAAARGYSFAVKAILSDGQIGGPESEIHFRVTRAR
jgi:hypothetical protein